MSKNVVYLHPRRGQYKTNLPGSNFRQEKLIGCSTKVHQRPLIPMIHYWMLEVPRCLLSHHTMTEGMAMLPMKPKRGDKFDGEYALNISPQKATISDITMGTPEIAFFCTERCCPFYYPFWIWMWFMLPSCLLELVSAPWRYESNSWIMLVWYITCLMHQLFENNICWII